MKPTPLATACALILAASLATAQQAQPSQPAAVPDTSQQQPSRAQQGHRHGPDAHRETMRLTKRLNLTPDQTARVEPILADRDQKMKELWSNPDLAPLVRHQQMRSLHQNSQQQLDAILTPEQLQQLKSMHHAGHNHPDRTQTPPPAA